MSTTAKRLTPAQRQVMEALKHAGAPLTDAELAAITGLDGIGRTTGSLRRAGLIRWVTDSGMGWVRRGGLLDALAGGA